MRQLFSKEYKSGIEPRNFIIAILIVVILIILVFAYGKVLGG